MSEMRIYNSGIVFSEGHPITGDEINFGRDINGGIIIHATNGDSLVSVGLSNIDKGFLKRWLDNDPNI